MTAAADGSDDGDDYFQWRRQLMTVTTFEDVDSGNMLMAMMNMNRDDYFNDGGSNNVR